MKKAADLLEKKRHHGLPVVNARGRLTGVLSLQDIDRAKDLKTKVKEIYTRNLLVVFPDDTLSSALRQMSEHDIGRLPVVSRTDKQKLLGVLRRADVIHAYNLALARRVEQRHHEGSVQLGAMTPDRVDVTDAIVEVGAPIAGKKMKEISFPKECVIASIQRGSKIIIPHGETTVQARDVLVIVAQGKAREEAMKLCRSDK